MYTKLSQEEKESSKASRPCSNYETSPTQPDNNRRTTTLSSPSAGKLWLLESLLQFRTPLGAPSGPQLVTEPPRQILPPNLSGNLMQVKEPLLS